MSLLEYQSYRDSGVDWIGKLPAHWQTGRLRTLVDIKKRIVGFEGLDVLSITQRGIRVRDVESNEGQMAESYAHYQLVESGDFAMNHMDLLTGWIDLSQRAGVTSPDYRVFSLRDDCNVDPHYLLRVLQNCYTQRIFYALGQGASHLGRWRLPTDAFQSFAVPLPPVSEQEAITAFLDRETAKIDALVKEQETLVELLEEKRRAVISQAVIKGLDSSAPLKHSGIKWLGEVPAHWATTKLRHVTRKIVDGAHFTPTYVDDGVPFLRVTDITRDRIDLDEVKRIPQLEHDELIMRCNPKRGDLLLSKNGTVGVPRVVEWDWPFSIFVSLCLLKLDVKLDAHYARYVFLSNAIKEQIADGSKQSTVSNLHLEKISGFSFPLPPLEEQKAIVANLNARTSRLEGLLSEARSSINLLRERRAALIYAAITGKKDFRDRVALPVDSQAA